MLFATLEAPLGDLAVRVSPVACKTLPRSERNDIRSKDEARAYFITGTTFYVKRRRCRCIALGAGIRRGLYFGRAGPSDTTT